MVYIKPRHAMMASTPTNIYVSFSNLKSTGLGQRIDLTSSPLAVENPTNIYIKKKQHHKLTMYTIYAISFHK